MYKKMKTAYGYHSTCSSELYLVLCMKSFTPFFNQDLEQGKFMAAINSRK